MWEYAKICILVWLYWCMAEKAQKFLACIHLFECLLYFPNVFSYSYFGWCAINSTDLQKIFYLKLYTIVSHSPNMWYKQNGIDGDALLYTEYNFPCSVQFHLLFFTLVQEVSWRKQSKIQYLIRKYFKVHLLPCKLKIEYDYHYKSRSGY